jgi:hypothetical protein
LPRIKPVANRSEILVVTSALVCVAFEAERLKVGGVVPAPVFSREDVIDLNGPLVG